MPTEKESQRKSAQGKSQSTKPEVVSTPTTEASTQATADTSKMPSEVIQEPARKITHDTLVEVYNNTQGKLVYKSDRNQVTWIWDEYGMSDLMPVSEVLAMKAGQSRFFEDQWVLILEDDVIKHLKLERFFKIRMTPDELEEFFDLPLDEMEGTLSKASNGLKSLIGSTALRKYEDGSLFDINKIKMFERVLGMTLITD